MSTETTFRLDLTDFEARVLWAAAVSAATNPVTSTEGSEALWDIAEALDEAGADISVEEDYL